MKKIVNASFGFMERLITELTLNLFDHEEGACLHVLAYLLQNKEEQLETVSRKVWTRAWISRRKSECVHFTTFQELVTVITFDKLYYYFTIGLSYHIV